MSAKAPKKDGKGYEYPVIGHMVGLEGKIRGDHVKLLAMEGYSVFSLTASGKSVRKKLPTIT